MENLIRKNDGSQAIYTMINSSGDEYTLFNRVKEDQLLGDPDSDLGSIVASDSDMTEYQDYLIVNENDVFVINDALDKISITKRKNDQYYFDTYIAVDGSMYSYSTFGELAQELLKDDYSINRLKIIN